MMELAQEVERLQQQVENLGRNSQAQDISAWHTRGWDTHRKIWENMGTSDWKILKIEISLGKSIWNGGLNWDFPWKIWAIPLQIEVYSWENPL